MVESTLRPLKSETRLQTLLGRLHVGVLRLTVEGEIVDANRACRTLLETFDGQPQHASHNALLLAMRRSAERNAELEQANRALESFAYTVSHDLRAPLRNLQGYVRALTEDCTGALDRHCQGYVNAIEEIAINMDAMIGDVLEFSRLSRINLPEERVALRTAAEEAIALFNSTVDEKAAKVALEVAESVSVLGHYQTVVQVLTNLLSNALKFVAEGVRPEVRLRSERRGSTRLRLWVEDNGIGIDPAHHQRVFEVFQRLHGEEKYPGTGIGLALVKKGVERMGGLVGVESTPGQGSRFWVELRATDPAA